MQQKIRTFGIRLLLLITILILIDRIGGSVLHHYYLKVKSGSEYKTIYAVEKSREDLLIMGSSRAYHHYVTTVLEQNLDMRSYNLGRDGAGVLYNYAIYKTICERRKPKMVIMDVNPEEFMAPNASYQLLYQLLPHYGKNKYINEVVLLRSPFEWLKVQSLLYRYNSQPFYIAVNNVQYSGIDTSKGYLALYGKLKDKPETVATNVREVDALLLHYFERFLEEAQRNNTRVVICISPVYRQYRRATPSIEHTYRICGKHKVPVLDFSREKLFLDHPEYFRDITHLNDTGAHIYTNKLLQFLQGNAGYLTGGS